MDKKDIVIIGHVEHSLQRARDVFKRIFESAEEIEMIGEPRMGRAYPIKAQETYKEFTYSGFDKMVRMEEDRQRCARVRARMRGRWNC